MIVTLLDGQDAYARTVLGYQQWHNANEDTLKAKAPDHGAYYETLAEDGIIGEHSRTQLIYDYMSREDTTVPEGAVIEVHGCSEFFPLDSTEECLAPNSPDEDAEQRDRRVEVFLFPKEVGILPAVPGEQATRGEPEYPEWRFRAVDTASLQAPGTDGYRVRLHDGNRHPLGDVVARVSYQSGAREDTTANGEGWIQVQSPTTCPSLILVEWQPRGDGTYEYRKEVQLDCHTSGTEATRARLHNIGYSRELDFGEAVKQFQRDYGVDNQPVPVGLVGGDLPPNTRARLDLIYGPPCNASPA